MKWSFGVDMVRIRTPLNTGGRYCGQYLTPPLTIIQPNGGEVWLMGSVHDIKWESTNLKQSDRLIIRYSRDGGASWFRIAQDIPALSFSYSWQVDNYPTTQGRVKILLQGNRSITDQSDANFTVQRRPVHHAPQAQRRRIVDDRAIQKHPLEPTKPRR